MSHRDSHPRQNNSSSTGTSRTQPIVRKKMNGKFDRSPGGAELSTWPVSELVNSQKLRYCGQSTSGPIQTTKTAMPNTTVPRAFLIRKSSTLREQTINVTSTAASRIGYNTSIPNGNCFSIARKPMNTANGATYGVKGYF